MIKRHLLTVELLLSVSKPRVVVHLHVCIFGGGNKHYMVCGARLVGLSLERERGLVVTRRVIHKKTKIISH